MKVRVDKAPTRYTIKDREGTEGTIWVQTYTEAMVEARNDSTMVRRQRGGRGVDYDFKMRNLRRYDLVNGMTDWDVTDEDGNKIELPPAGDAQARMRFFREVVDDAFITNQITRIIREHNQLDNDEEAEQSTKTKQNEDPLADPEEQDTAYGVDPFADPDEQQVDPTTLKAS